MNSKRFPLQPIEGGRFVPNGIVKFLLESGPFDMNQLALMRFSNEERAQFAQLIGYSVDGWAELGYVDSDLAETAFEIEARPDEELSREAAENAMLREKLNTVRDSMRIAADALFRVHPDDLQA